MTMTRRLFSMFLPVAPTVAGEVGRGVAKNVASTLNADPYPPGPISLKVLTPPAGYAKYQEVENTLHAVKRFRQRRNYFARDYERIDPNIMALKSVSLQHKAMMHIMQQEREELDNRSYLDKLADELGLKEFFKKRQDEYSLDNSGPAASSW
jgi:hypothetical protein